MAQPGEPTGVVPVARVPDRPSTHALKPGDKVQVVVSTDNHYGRFGHVLAVSDDDEVDVKYGPFSTYKFGRDELS